MCNLHWCYTFCTGVTLFAPVLHLNCTALSQSESSNFFMCIIITIMLLLCIVVIAVAVVFSCKQKFSFIQQLSWVPSNRSKTYGLLNRFTHAHSSYHEWYFLVILFPATYSRPIYSSVLSRLANERKWGWSWPCFDRNLSSVMLMTVLSC